MLQNLLIRKRFADLKFEDFKNLAKDESLSKYEKIGFPDIYRKDYEDYIFQDVLRKLDNLLNKNQIILDIGPGCTELPQEIINLCKKKSILYIYLILRKCWIYFQMTISLIKSTAAFQIILKN